MSEGKFTPGPWEVSPRSRLSVNAGGIKITQSSYIGGQSCSAMNNASEVREANAHLIAAAPDMLEVLESIARYPVAQSYPDGPCIVREDMEEVLAAIKKAKGEQ